MKPDGYLDYFLHIPGLTLTGILTLLLLGILRLSPIVSLVPFFGSKLSPAPTRISIAIVLGFLFMPTIARFASPTVGFNAAFLGLAMKEIFVGFIIAFIAMIPFILANTAGLFIDYMRGASMMQMQDPNLQTQTSPIGQLYNYILIVIFFAVGGPFFFFNALQLSFELIPVDKWFNTNTFGQHTPLFHFLVDIVNQIVTIALQLGAPAILAILMAEIFLGVANRLAQQVQIAFLGMSLKSLAGLTLLWISWFFTLRILSQQTLNWYKMLDDILKTLKIY